MGEGGGDAGVVAGGIGLSRGASLTLGAARRATPTHCCASCTDCAKVSVDEGGAVEVYPLEASRTLEGVSAHIKVTNGAGYLGRGLIRMRPGFG